MLAVGGCAQTTIVPPARQTGAEVELNRRSTVRVGGLVYADKDFVANDTVTLTSGVSGFYNAARFNVPPGTRLRAAVRHGNPWYCTEGVAVRSMMGVPMGLACFHDRDDDGVFDLMDNTVGGFGSTAASVSYQRTSGTMAGGRRYELRYLGLVGSALNFEYREFRQDPTLPSHQEVVSLSMPGLEQEMLVRDIRLRIHEASAGSLTYTVLSAPRP